MEDELLSRQQSHSLNVDGKSKGTTSVDAALAQKASQGLPEWHYLANLPSELQVLIFFWGFLP